jgi:hypothetical protein
MIQRRANFEGKKELAETIVSIKPDKYFKEITGKTEEQYFKAIRESQPKCD